MNSHSAYGENEAEVETLPQRFHYTGREYDKVTGLYHYHAREYDPASTGFSQEASIFFASENVLYLFLLVESI